MGLLLSLENSLEIPHSGLVCDYDLTRKNLLKYPEDLTNGVWDASTANVTRTINTITFAGNGSYIYQDISIPDKITGKTFTVSVWLSSANKANITIRFVSYVGDDAVVQVVTLSNTPTKFVLTRTFTQVDGVHLLIGFDNRLTYGADGLAGTITVSNIQLEVGSVATAYESNSGDPSLATIVNKVSGGSALSLGAAGAAPSILIEDGVVKGYSFVTDDYMLTPALAGISMAGDWTAILVGKFDGTAGTVFSLADPTVNNRQIDVYYAAGLGVWGVAGATSNDSGGGLVVSSVSYSALIVKSSGGIVKIKLFSSTASLQINNPLPSGTPRVGIGVLATLACGTIADSLKQSRVLLFSRATKDSEDRVIYNFLKYKWAPSKGIVVL